MFKNYSHKEIKESYTKDKLQEEAESRGLSTSGTKEELIARIKEDDKDEEKEYMFPDGPATIKAASRKEAEEKFKELQDNDNEE